MALVDYISLQWPACIIHKSAASSRAKVEKALSGETNKPVLCLLSARLWVFRLQDLSVKGHSSKTKWPHIESMEGLTGARCSVITKIQWSSLVFVAHLEATCWPHYIATEFAAVSAVRESHTHTLSFKNNQPNIHTQKPITYHLLACYEWCWQQLEMPLR